MQGQTQDFKLGGPKLSEKKIQICFHIVLTNYQSRQIHKNHCFSIY